MPDPISSFSPSSEANACVDETSDAYAEAPAPRDAVATAPPSAVKSLVAQFSPSGVPAALTQHANDTFYSFSGPSSDGESYRVAAGFVDMHDTQGQGLDALGVSVQFGKDADVQATTLRATVAGSHAGFGLSVTGDGPSARANLGEHNDDGSLGGNVGAGANFIGVEATLSTPVGSLTAGASVSASVSGSMGVRDADHDGKPELCAKFSMPAFTLGACVEQFW